MRMNSLFAPILLVQWFAPVAVERNSQHAVSSSTRQVEQERLQEVHGLSDEYFYSSSRTDRLAMTPEDRKTEELTRKLSEPEKADAFSEARNFIEVCKHLGEEYEDSGAEGDTKPTQNELWGKMAQCAQGLLTAGQKTQGTMMDGLNENFQYFAKYAQVFKNLRYMEDPTLQDQFDKEHTATDTKYDTGWKYVSKQLGMLEPYTKYAAAPDDFNDGADGEKQTALKAMVEDENAHADDTDFFEDSGDADVNKQRDWEREQRLDKLKKDEELRLNQMRKGNRLVTNDNGNVQHMTISHQHNMGSHQTNYATVHSRQSHSQAAANRHTDPNRNAHKQTTQSTSHGNNINQRSSNFNGGYGGSAYGHGSTQSGRGHGRY